MMTIYRDNIINALQALSDYDFQKIAWFDNDQGLCYSFYENIMDLFYNSALDDALKTKEVVFGEPADSALRDLEAGVDVVSKEDYESWSFIDSPKMQAIREMATKVLFLVQTSTGAGSTVNLANAHPN